MSPRWWAHLDSNQDLTGYEPGALPLSYGPEGVWGSVAPQARLWVAGPPCSEGVWGSVAPQARLWVAGPPCSTSGLMSSRLQEAPELLRPRRMAQLAQRLGLDLSDALARDREILADLLERVLASVGEAEAQAQDLLLARGER